MRTCFIRGLSLMEVDITESQIPEFTSPKRQQLETITQREGKPPLTKTTYERVEHRILWDKDGNRIRIVSSPQLLELLGIQFRALSYAEIAHDASLRKIEENHRKILRKSEAQTTAAQTRIRAAKRLTKKTEKELLTRFKKLDAHLLDMKINARGITEQLEQSRAKVLHLMKRGASLSVDLQDKSARIIDLYDELTDILHAGWRIRLRWLFTGYKRNPEKEDQK